LTPPQSADYLSASPTPPMPAYNFVNYLWDDAQAAALDPEDN
jgi:hypothetical protein